jgi:hypothetical protein
MYRISEWVRSVAVHKSQSIRQRISVFNIKYCKQEQSTHGTYNFEKVFCSFVTPRVVTGSDKPVNKFEPAGRRRFLPVHIKWLDRPVLPVFTVFKKMHMRVNSRLVRNYVSATVILLKSQL